MKLGLMTDSLGQLPLPELACTCRELGIEQLEFGCGNWSRAPHMDLEALLDSQVRREELSGTLAEQGLTISALNCSGNPLHPGETGERDRAVVEKALRLSELLGLTTVVMMSGLPGGGPDDRYPNWVVTSWPPETAEMLDYQWRTAIPFWRELAQKANGHGVTRVALEPHACQLVYNVENFYRLRDAVGKTIGFNLDPSHLFWMGGDPLAIARELDDAIYHVHLKDVKAEPAAALNTMMDGKPIESFRQRSWNFRIPGDGHDVEWWLAFVQTLRSVGYDGVLSIEQEDLTLPVMEALQTTCRRMRELLN